MSNITFKTGDRVKCSGFLYREDNKYKEVIGIFIRYNKYGNDICYASFGQPPVELSCFTESLTHFIKNQQLLFEFMHE